MADPKLPPIVTERPDGKVMVDIDGDTKNAMWIRGSEKSLAEAEAGRNAAPATTEPEPSS